MTCKFVGGKHRLRERHVKLLSASHVGLLDHLDEHVLKGLVRSFNSPKSALDSQDQQG